MQLERLNFVVPRIASILMIFSAAPAKTQGLRRLLEVLAIGFSLATSASVAQAAAEEAALRVHWAGWSFAGDDASVARSFPRCHAVHEANAAEDPLNGPLREVAARSLPAGVELVVGELIQLQGRAGLALTFAMDGEYVTVDRMSDFHAVSIWLSGQIIVFDFGSAQLLASFPVGVLLTTAAKAEPTEEFLQAKVRDMLLAEEGPNNINLLEEFGRRLKGLKLRQDYPVKVQLREVRLADKTRARMPRGEGEQPESMRVFRQFVGGSFSKALSGQLNLPLLPFVIPDAPDGPEGAKVAGAGQAMKILMGRVADGKVYNLKVPEPDYVFDLEVAGFSKAVVSESRGVKKWVYASYVDAGFQEPLRGTTFLRQRLVNPGFEDIPDGASIDDWAGYRSSLYQLLNRFVGALSSAPSEEWIDAQPAASILRGQLKAVGAKLELRR